MEVPPSSISILAEPPWAEMDQLIRPVVAALREAGYRTWSSCEGHKDSRPWVEIAPSGDPLQASIHLHSWLRDVGLHGATVSLYWEVNLSHVGDPLVHVEWWNKDDVAAWASGRERPEASAAPT